MKLYKFSLLNRPCLLGAFCVQNLYQLPLSPHLAPAWHLYLAESYSLTLVFVDSNMKCGEVSGPLGTNGAWLGQATVALHGGAVPPM